MTSPGMVTSVARKNIWLDVLPDEVCVQIAAHVSHGKQDFALQQLAFVSRKQQRAVVSSLNGCYVEKYGQGAIWPWRKIFVNSGVVEAQLQALCSIRVDDFVSADVISIVNEPTLRKLTITDDPRLLEVVLGSSSVVDLTIRLQDIKSWPLVLKILQKLNLQRLAMIFIGVHDRGFCCLEKERLLTPAMVAAFCPELTSLELEHFACSTCRAYSEERFVSEISSLRETTIGNISILPQSKVLDRLPNFDKVEHDASFSLMLDKYDQMYVVKQLAAVITDLSLIKRRPDYEVLRAEDVRKLPAFPRLKSLICSVTMGAEIALVGFCRTSPLLHTLRIEWGLNVFESIVPGYALRLVETTPNLVNLALLHIQISSAELKAVLTSVGSRLESLSISTELQQKEESDILMTILETVLERNCNLRELCLDNTHVSSEYSMKPSSRALLSRLFMRKPLFSFRIRDFALTSCIWSGDDEDLI